MVKVTLIPGRTKLQAVAWCFLFYHGDAVSLFYILQNLSISTPVLDLYTIFLRWLILKWKKKTWSLNLKQCYLGLHSLVVNKSLSTCSIIAIYQLVYIIIFIEKHVYYRLFGITDHNSIHEFRSVFCYMPSVWEPEHNL